MKRIYHQIACYLKDAGRCKYAALSANNNGPPMRGPPRPNTCFCEKIDEDAARERELLEMIMADVRERNVHVSAHAQPTSNDSRTTEIMALAQLRKA